MSVTVVTIAAVGVPLVLLTCAGVFIYRRCFAGQKKGFSAGANKAKLGVEEGGAAAQCKALNDVIGWVFGHPGGIRWVEDWTEAWTRALTQQAARQKESFQVRFEKIRDVHSAPQLSNLSTRLLSSDRHRSLVLTATVEWKRFEMVLSLTSKATPNAVCSIDCHVIVFEFHGIAEGVFLSSEDGSKLTVYFPTEPKMKLEVKPNQETNIDVDKIERLVRDTISGTEVHLPLWTKHHLSGPVTGSNQLEHFESSHHAQTTSAANHLFGNVPEPRRKLLVKVIKANGLGTSQEKDYGSLQPFCVALMDSPVQKYVTSSVKNTTNPFFDEHFVFDLDQTTKKLTFELHDKVRPENGNFLGMAFLASDDFVRTRHVLPLTGRGPMTFGALTVEVTILDSAELPTSVLSLSPNVECIAPPGESNISGLGSSPTVTVSAAEPISLPALGTPTGSQVDPSGRESKSLPRLSALPPKGDAAKKRSTLVGAIKKRFQRKKPESRSQSADRAQEKASLAAAAAEGGIYLTPPPSRTSASMEHVEIPQDAGSRGRSNSVRSNLRRLFHKKRHEDSPTRLSSRGVDLSSEESAGHPSPHLSSASASRQSSIPAVASTPPYEHQLR